MDHENELEAEAGQVLPQREMMSLVSTDPGDPMAGIVMPDEPPTMEQPPVEQPTVEGGSEEPTSTTVQQSDSASASS